MTCELCLNIHISYSTFLEGERMYIMCMYRILKKLSLSQYLHNLLKTVTRFTKSDDRFITISMRLKPVHSLMVDMICIAGDR